MKKFMTVLLVIAVMFTFSFGSAFADVTYSGTGALTAEQQAIYDAAVGPSGAILDARFEAAWAANTDHRVEAEYQAYIISAKAYTDLKVEAKAELVKQLCVEAAKAKATAEKVYQAFDTNAEIIAIIDAALADELAAAQYAIDYAKEIAKLDTVDVYAYSTEDYDDDYTHQEKAAAIIADAKALAAKEAAKLDSDSTFANYVFNIVAVREIVTNNVKEIKLDSLGTGVYELTNAKVLKTADAAADKAVTEAQKAALKAVVAQKVADYQKAEGVKADADLVAAYIELYTVRIESGFTTKAESINAVKAGFANSKLVDNYDAVQKVVAYAEKYKAEKDADGNLVRNAEAIDKIVKAAKKAAYNADQDNTWNGKVDGVDAIDAIEAATVESTAVGLAYAKETAKTLINYFVSENGYNYYPAELAKLNAIAEEAVAKIEAAEKTTDITKETGIYKTYLAKLKAVNAKQAVKDSIDDKTSYTNAETALKNYVSYYNNTLTTAAEYNAKALDANAIVDVLDAFYGEAGARTEAELKALKDQVITLVEKLPTAGAQAAAKKAAEDAIKALPTVVTLADEATVQAAADAAKAYKAVYGNSLESKYTDALDAARTALYNAYRLDLNKKVVAVAKTDKDALKALKAEFKAADKKIGDAEKGKCLKGAAKFTAIDAYKVVTDALETIQATEKAAAKKAIHAIPINVTEADKATVEAARALYEAYVAEYTDYYAEKFDGNAADEFVAEYRELALAEAALGLNDKSEEIAKLEAEAAKAAKIAAVEGLKITANSSAKKGSITVKWSVKGDAEGVKYQVYKSTKAQTGYKKAITTSKTSFKNTKNIKKGTRYYYKVRAIATIEGVTYYSDWSNKANRIAK